VLESVLHTETKESKRVRGERTSYSSAMTCVRFLRYEIVSAMLADSCT